MSTEIEFLGTGTSTGVPEIGCNCTVCTSTDPRDHRLRASAIIRTQGVNLLIDCGPDFRTQMLQAKDWHIDALLLTHIHYDHVGGIDDLRIYCREHDFPIYAREDVLADLHQRIPYCFNHVNPYPGVARFQEHIIGTEPFKINAVEVRPISIMHYRLPIVGYRIGDVAYITDCKTISDEAIDQLKGLKLLVFNALRLEEEHISHMILRESLAVVQRIAPQQCYLTHMSHQMGLQAVVEKLLPENVHFAYDGLCVQVD